MWLKIRALAWSCSWAGWIRCNFWLSTHTRTCFSSFYSQKNGTFSLFFANIKKAHKISKSCVPFSIGPLFRLSLWILIGFCRVTCFSEILLPYILDRLFYSCFLLILCYLSCIGYSLYEVGYEYNGKRNKNYGYKYKWVGQKPHYLAKYERWSHHLAKQISWVHTVTVHHIIGIAFCNIPVIITIRLYRDNSMCIYRTRKSRIRWIKWYHIILLYGWWICLLNKCLVSPIFQIIQYCIS